METTGGQRAYYELRDAGGGAALHAPVPCQQAQQHPSAQSQRSRLGPRLAGAVRAQGVERRRAQPSQRGLHAGTLLSVSFVSAHDDCTSVSNRHQERSKASAAATSMPNTRMRGCVRGHTAVARELPEPRIGALAHDVAPLVRAVRALAPVAGARAYVQPRQDDARARAGGDGAGRGRGPAEGGRQSVRATLRRHAATHQPRRHERAPGERDRAHAVCAPGVCPGFTAPGDRALVHGWGEGQGVVGGSLPPLIAVAGFED